MIVPAVTLKILGGAIAIGTVASSIAVPVTLSMSSQAGVVLNGFLSNHKSRFQGKCQLLIKDEDVGKAREEDKGYLIVCEKDSSSGVEFYFYSFGEEPKKITKLERNGVSGSNQTKIKVKLVGGKDGDPDVIASNGNWTDLIDQSLEGCSITKNNDEGGNKKWSLKCPKDGTSKEISLTPIIIY